MNTAAWTGLVLGVLIGAICGFWQAVDLNRGTGLRRVASSAARFVFLIGALLTAYLVARADKLWLVGSVAVVYTAVFLLKLRQTLTKRK
jgi:hypothetical protein